MTEIEQAYRTLDLKPGASIKEIVEARDDLLVLWDPDRLKSHPRLRSRATVKSREIHGAYQVLMQDPAQGEAGPAREAPSDLSSAPALGSEAVPAADTSVHGVGGSASLFDEVFRDRKSEKRGRLPLGPILAGAVVVLSAVLILLLIGGGDSPPEPVDTGLEVPAPPPIPPEPAGPPVDSGAEPAVASGPGKAVESGPDQPAAVSPPPPQQEIATAPKAPVPTPPEPAVSAPPQPEKPKPVRPPRPGGRPVLVRESGEADPPAAAPTPEPEPKPANEEADKRKLEEAENAYKALVSGSKAAQRLVGGQVPSFRFTEWSIAGRRGTELLVDMIAEQFAGEPIHFIWGVDTATGKVRALSQAARDLERAVAEE